VSPARLLVIDDADAVRHVWCDFLRLRGYEVDEASEGAHGLRLFMARPHDLVLTDLRMAGLDGWAVADHVTRSSRTPVILITGSATEEDQQRADTLGLALLHKPVNLRDLERVVAERLNWAASDPSLPRHVR
jgi:CheY-like chemotaxis protein